MTLDHLILRYAHIAMEMLALLSGASAMAPLTHVIRVRVLPLIKKTWTPRFVSQTS